MSIYVWTSEIKNIYVWTTPVKEVYVWTTKVRPLIKKIEYLIVWGWWSWGWFCWWWGWAWWVLYNLDYTITSWTYPVVIWAGWAATISRAQDGDRDNYNRWKNWWNTTFLWLTAYGWGWGGWRWSWGNQGKWQDGWSWGWASWWYSNSIWYWIAWQWYNWWACYNASGVAWQGWWWWAWAVWASSTSSKSGNGWDGIVNPIVWSTAWVLISGQYWIAWWGWWASMWASSNTQWSWGKWGWWNGAVYNQNNSSSSNWSWATTYGWWGWWAAGRDGVNLYSWAWYQWIVVVRYLTGSLIATWWTVTTYWNYTIHTFTSNGNFIVS